MYHAMGITSLLAKDARGRSYNMVEEGKPQVELFG